MTRTAISPGVYRDAAGGFWARPFIKGRRTWRKLAAVKLHSAIREHANTDYTAPAGNVAALAQLYLDASCPNRRLETRPAPFCAAERARLAQLLPYFGPRPAAELRLADIPGFARWRMRRVKQGTGERTVDKELCTLSNVFNYGVAIGQLEINYIRSARPRYRKSADVRHSREVMPPDADAIHRIAEYFFEEVRSEVFAWLCYFSMFTGCRQSELRRLMLDAKDETHAGFTRPGYLYLGRRSKGGLNPWAEVDREFANMQDCFLRWHAARFPKAKVYFPSMDGQSLLDPGAFGHALTRACRLLRLPHITPHGFRSYFATKLHRDGRRDEEIAAAIGDRTVALVQNTYRDCPGGEKLTWLPSENLPAWQRWQATEKKFANLIR